MKSERLSAVRKALMWWLDWPKNPFVCVSAATDFGPATAYLQRLNEVGEPTVTVQHLLAATIATVLKEFPEANCRIVGRRIQRLKHVGMAMPVSLLGHASGDRHDLSLALLERVETLSVRQVAEACRDLVDQERSGRPRHAIVRTLTRFIDRTPYPLVARGLDVLDWFGRRRLVAELFYRRLPVSTGLSNPGSAFGRVEGALLRAIAFEMPQRLVHVGTGWAVSAVQDEVVAVDGEPRVRPVLPVIMVFDHRLFDGILAGKILVRFAEIVRDPESVFGPNGDLVPHPKGKSERSRGLKSLGAQHKKGRRRGGDARAKPGGGP